MYTQTRITGNPGTSSSDPLDIELLICGQPLWTTWVVEADSRVDLCEKRRAGGVTWCFGDRDPGTRPASPLSHCVVQRQPAGPLPRPSPPPPLRRPAAPACLPFVPLRVESGTGVGPAVEFLASDASTPLIPGNASDERRV